MELPLTASSAKPKLEAVTPSVKGAKDMRESVLGRPKRVRLVGGRQRPLPQPQLVVGKCQIWPGFVHRRR